MRTAQVRKSCRAEPTNGRFSLASNGNRMVDTMPPEPESFAQRLPLPEGWAGLQGEEFAAATGVPDAVFVHVRHFMGAAKSREGAIAMARKALAF